jgi:hypothetical protein
MHVATFPSADKPSRRTVNRSNRVARRVPSGESRADRAEETRSASRSCSRRVCADSVRTP